MDKTFQSDAFLYLAFMVVGFAAIAETFYQKLLCVGASVAILVIRSLVKKYLYK